MNERASAVPEHLRPVGALERAVDEARRAKQALDDASVAAQRQLAEAKEKRIGLESAAAAATEAETGAADHEKSCAESFDRGSRAVRIRR